MPAITVIGLLAYLISFFLLRRFKAEQWFFTLFWLLVFFDVFTSLLKLFGYIR